MGDFDFGGGLDLQPSYQSEGGAGPDGGQPPASSGFSLFGRQRDLYANRPQLNPDPTQDRINSVQAGRAALQKSIDNPLRAFLKPREWREDVEKAGQLDQQIFQAQQAVQNQHDMRQTALNAGMDPARVNLLGPTATQATIMNAWTEDYAGGSFNAARALNSMGDVGKGILAQHEGSFMPALAVSNEQAQNVIDRLNNAAAAGQTAYDATLNQLRREGVDPSRVLSNYVPGFVVPDKAGAWAVKGAGAQGTLQQAKQMVSQYNTKQSQIGLSTPITDEKENNAVGNGMFKGSTGQPIEGGSGTTLPNSEKGWTLPQGSAVLQNYGKTWSNANPAQVETFNKQLGSEQSKGILSNYKMASNFYKTVNDPKMFSSAAGVALVADELGALGRDVAEGSKAAGSIGLSKMLDTKYGNVGTWRNKAASEWSDLKDFIDRVGAKYGVGGLAINNSGELVDKNGVRVTDAPRLSQGTIQGIKDIAEFKRNETLAEVQDRIGQPMTTAGRLGMKLDNTGLDKDLQNDPAIMGKYNEGRDSYLKDVAAHKAVFEGDTRIMLRQGTNNPDAALTPLPKDPNATQPQRIIPSPGHEEPPASGMVHPPQGGEKQGGATVQLAWAKSPDNPYPGMASGIKPPDPNATTQANVTPNGAALLSTLRGSESNGPNANSYNLIVGGKRFTNYDDHPREFGSMNGRPVNSTAAGAYQFTKSTWDDVTKQYGPLFDRNKDGKVAFTPQNQDKAAWLLAQDRYAKVTGGNLEQDLNDPAKRPQIMQALNSTWTSLPGGAEPNNATPSRMQALAGYLAKYGGAAATAMSGPAGLATAAYQLAPEKVQQAVRDTAIDQAPVIGSVAGAVGGAAVGGVPGGMAGGAAGGAAGQAVKNYMQGNDISKSVGREAALGAVGGIASGARPVLAAGARIAAGAGLGATNEALNNPKAGLGDIAAAGAVSGGAAALTEGALSIVGRGLGMAGDKIFSGYRTDVQKELAKAGEVIAQGKPEAPKAVGVVPVSDSAKAAHEAAVKKYDAAVEYAKDKGIDPEHLAYSVTQATKQGEAVAAKPVFAEKADIGKGYQEIKSDVEATGVGAPKQQPLSNGPLSMVGNNPDVPKTQFAMDRATQAENNITRPAANWGEKYQQLFDERSKLLEEERAFLGGANPDPNKARTVRAIADNVRMQQSAAANYIFGAQKGAQVIAKLEDLNKRYARLMDVTHGGDIVANMTKLGKAGADARAAFADYAKDDPQAARMARVLMDERNAPKEGKLTKYAVSAIVNGVAGFLGFHGAAAHMAATVIGMEGPKMLNDWALKRAAGGPVSLKSMVQQRVAQVSSHLKSQTRAAATRAVLETAQ